MPDPYLDQLLRPPTEAEVLEQVAETQREQIELAKRRADDTPTARVDLYLDEFRTLQEGDTRHLEGEAAERRVAQREVEYRRETQALREQDRQFEAELDPVQVQVAREMGISSRTALAIVRGNPAIARATASSFLVQVAETRRRKEH